MNSICNRRAPLDLAARKLRYAKSARNYLLHYCSGNQTVYAPWSSYQQMIKDLEFECYKQRQIYHELPIAVERKEDA